MTEGMSSSGYGDYMIYCTEHEDMPKREDFDRYNRIASCMVDYLAGRGVDAENYYVREAVHWQIWFMRGKGSLQKCFSAPPKKESFADYSVERGEVEEPLRVLGIEVCPMAVQILSTAGILSRWL